MYWTIGFVISLVMRVLGMTYRYRFVYDKDYDSIKNAIEEKKYIYALWHENFLHTIMSNHRTPHASIASYSKDGEIATGVLHGLGYKASRGSSSKRGMKGLIELIRWTRKGYPAAITVDGPRGPARTVKEGIFELAKITQLPIVPYSCYPNKMWRVRSWDKQIIAKPFSRVIVRFGRPIVVTKETPRETYPQLVQDLKKSLDDLQEQTQKEFEAQKKPSPQREKSGI